MDDQPDPFTPFLPHERHQSELRRAAAEEERRITEKAAKIKAKYGQEIGQRIQYQHDITDEPIRNTTVDVLTRDVAENKIGIEDLRARHFEEAIGKAQVIEATKAQEQEKRESEKLRQQEGEKEQHAQQEREAQQVAALDAARQEPAAGPAERFSATLAQSEANRRQQTHAASMERLANTASRRPNYTRFEDMKREQASNEVGNSLSSYKSAEPSSPRGEISDAKAERLSKLEATISQSNERASGNQAARTTEGKGGAGRSGR